MSLKELPIYDIIKCELQKNDVHILSNPTSLPCGNSACLTCIEKLIQANGQLECTYCHEKHDFSTQKYPRIIPIEKAIDAHLDQLSQVLMEKIQQTQQNIELTFNERSETIKNLVKTMKHSIKKRIDNIKQKLDDLEDNLLLQCDKLKFSVNNDILAEEKKFRQFETNELLAHTVELINESSRDNDFLRKQMYKLEAHLKKLESLKDDHKLSIDKLKFNENLNWLPDYSHIGFVEGIHESDNPTFEDFSTGDRIFKQISLKFKPYAFCELKNGHLAISAFEKNKLVVLNDEYKIIREIKEVNGLAFKYPSGICVDNENNVYLCDQYNHRVIVFDNLINSAKLIISENLENPLAVYFFSNNLYVLDNSSKTIKIFDKSGNYLNWLSLRNQDGQQLVDPRFHAINSDSIIVNDNYSTIYVYDELHSLRQTIQATSNTRIMAFKLIDNFLYTHEIYVDNQKTITNYLVCYERRDSSIFSEYEHEWEKLNKYEFMPGTLARSYSMSKIGNHLALCLYEHKNIILFKS